MADETERPEDTVRRFAQQIQELLEWQAKYTEAAKVWDDLELKDNDQVVEAVLFAKIVNFDGEGGTGVGIGGTSGLDWIGQLGLLEAGKLMVMRDLYGTVEDDD